MLWDKLTIPEVMGLISLCLESSYTDQGDRGGNEKGTQRGPVSVEVVEGHSANQNRKVSSVRNILPQRRVTITLKASGKIEKIYVHEGDLVQRGDPLVQLERTDFIMAVEGAEASLKTSNAAFRNAEANFKMISIGSRRLRPILITTFTTVFGLLPLAMSRLEGSEA